jgi:hypothetical protein
MNEKRTEGPGERGAGGGPGRAVRSDGATLDGGHDSAVRSGRDGILAASAGVGWTTLRRAAAAALNELRAPRESLQPLAPQGLRGSVRP